MHLPASQTHNLAQRVGLGQGNVGLFSHGEMLEGILSVHSSMTLFSLVAIWIRLFSLARKIHSKKICF